MFRIVLLFLCLILLTTGCSSGSGEAPAEAAGATPFRLLDPAISGVTFSNELREDYDYNILTYEYLYNGGGVAVGDINQDGLPDLYFSATFAPNKLYLNKGNLQFEDITESAGVAVVDGFKTGVTMADVNGDGLLDIFVCRTGKNETDPKDNLLFINNGDLTFTERAAAFGLADGSNSNHANFFDYDLDGDLDLFLLNHRLGFKDAVRMRLQQLPDGGVVRQTSPATKAESDRLYRNDNGRFTEVTREAGIENSAFGLSATVADINQDGFPDIYVANDYIEPDYIYINNGDGTFTDRYFDYLRHSSQNSMGSDIADFNNDGLVDIIVLDMIAEDPFRYKELMNVMQLERYNLLVRYGYGHQVGRNVLQVNNGVNPDGVLSFSEVGHLAGVAQTDWSWGSLFADFNNDGYKDLYIGNGYRRDVTNLDYMTYTRDSIERLGGLNRENFPDINDFLRLIPSLELPNYLFLNQGDLRFENVTKAYGLADPAFSNGAAYADLDADGDLDLIINNINKPAFIYENRNRDAGGYLQFAFRGSDRNTQGIGVKVKLLAGDQLQYQELRPNRGFFSSSEPVLHFGLGDRLQADRVEVTWPDGRIQLLENVVANQRLTVDYQGSAEGSFDRPPVPAPLFAVAAGNAGLTYRHRENDFEDLERERLLPHRLSRLGPAMAVGDVNGDGAEDLFVGGAAGSPGALFVQTAGGNFREATPPALPADQDYEDTEALLFDADGDGDLDLYVGSGGNAQPVNSSLYHDRLYLNDGQGQFSRAPDFPALQTSTGAAAVLDYDGDGDLDLLLGGRVTPGAYPTAPRSYLLRNDGGRFQVATGEVFSQLKEMGMISALAVADLDGDQRPEVILTGEWMPLRVFSFDGARFVDRTEAFGLLETTGWWNCVEVADMDGDGDLDLIAGNLGQNSRLRAPLSLYAADFDRNGTIDPVMCFRYEGEEYPFAGRDILVKQMPGIKKKFARYADFADATVQEVLGEKALLDATRYEAVMLHSTWFENRDGKFTPHSLPVPAQVAPVQDVLVGDYDGDGRQDLLLVGNSRNSEPETGVMDAMNGVLLLGDGKGHFTIPPNRVHGFWADREAREIAEVQLPNTGRLLLVANNDGPLQVFRRLLPEVQ